MRTCWIVPRRLSRAELGLDLDDMSLLLDAAAEPAPGNAILSFLNRIVPVDYLSIVRFGASGPTMIEGLARRAELRDVTRECFARYRACFVNADDVVHKGQQMRDAAEADSPVLALHMDRADLPDPAWREQIYERECLSARLTLLYAARPRDVYAIQLYRHERHGGFAPSEIDRVVGVAPLLRKAHAQALATAPRSGHEADVDERIARAGARMERVAPTLSAREAAVCARIACGLSVDGIAADLGVAPSTIVTLRRRAYAKLGVNDRLAVARLVS